MSAVAVLPQRACWVVLRRVWSRSVCNSCHLLCSRDAVAAQSCRVQPVSRRSWSRDARVASSVVIPCSRVDAACYSDGGKKEDLQGQSVDEQKEESLSFEKVHPCITWTHFHNPTLFVTSTEKRTPLLLPLCSGYEIGQCPYFHSSSRVIVLVGKYLDNS